MAPDTRFVFPRRNRDDDRRTDGIAQSDDIIRQLHGAVNHVTTVSQGAMDRTL